MKSKPNRFRFNAWDKRMKRMYYGIEPFNPKRDNTGGGDCGCCPCWISYEATPYAIESAEFDDLILLQSTGLLDKNGKEIFEGDILDVNMPHYCVVSWVEFESIGIGYRGMWVNQLDINLAERYCCSHRLSIDDCKISEVVGNKYENPELMGDEG